MDGLTPKYLAEEERVIKNSQSIWELLSNGGADSAKDLKNAILSKYGVRFYYQEIVSHH
jgi:hypothetical protein